MDTPNVGAGSEELPAQRVPKADYRTKAWLAGAGAEAGRCTGEMRQKKEVVEALPEPGEPG
jgi:hypothetical protein